MKVKLFIIKGPIDEGEQLYWSNIDGWGSKNTATHFTEEEIKSIYLPIENTGIEPL